MNEDRRRVLDMLSGGKISVDEAERLLIQIDGYSRLIGGNRRLGCRTDHLHACCDR